MKYTVAHQLDSGRHEKDRDHSDALDPGECRLRLGVHGLRQQNRQRRRRSLFYAERLADHRRHAVRRPRRLCRPFIQVRQRFWAAARQPV